MGARSRGGSTRRHDGQVVHFPGLPRDVALPDLPGALCAQTDPELWFPDQGGPAQPAKEICSRCPERVPCLRWALEAGEQFGIWGGATADERRRMGVRGVA